MILRETPLAGVFVIEPQPVSDERGFFARVFDETEVARVGLSTRVAQCGISFNSRKGTLRGLHFQMPPFTEDKIVRCTRGRVWDVVADLRSNSASYGKWVATTLTDSNRLAVAIPEGCAHGFITLDDDCELFYQISNAYNASAAAGVRWDDPTLAIEWPEAPRVISERDRSLPPLSVLGGVRG